MEAFPYNGRFWPLYERVINNGLHLQLTVRVFKIFKTDIKEEESTIEDIEKERKFPSDDCFHLVAIKKWEDDIIWSPEDVKLNPLSEGIAGWIPSANIRTTLAYANQHTSGLFLNTFGLAK